MSKKQAKNPQPIKRVRNRQLRIRSVLRKEPDLGKIARTVVAIAVAQAEKEAQEDAANRTSAGDQQ